MLAHDLAHADPRRLSQKEYARMGQLGFFRDERVELVHGIVLRMSPIGPRHADIVERLTELLVTKLVGRARVRVQLPISAAGESEPQPDIAVVPLASYAKEHPNRALLVIEVAESSLAYDRETKAPLYAASSVDEYWIVDVARREVIVLSRPVDGRYTEERVLRSGESGESLKPLAFDDVSIALDDLLPA
jgi:Uma2 family endonuclease